MEVFKGDPRRYGVDNKTFSIKEFEGLWPGGVKNLYDQFEIEEFELYGLRITFKANGVVSRPETPEKFNGLLQTYCCTNPIMPPDSLPYVVVVNEGDRRDYRVRQNTKHYTRIMLLLHFMKLDFCVFYATSAEGTPIIIDNIQKDEEEIARVTEYIINRGELGDFFKTTLSDLTDDLYRNEDNI